MPALTILAPPGAGDFDLSGVNRHDLNAEPMKKQIEFAAGHDTPTGFQHNGSLQCIWGGEQARSVLPDEFEEILPLRLRQKYGKQGGSVDHHQRGSPWGS